MGKLEGKIALITGGNSGIALATAKQFVNEGASIFITGRRDPELAAAVKEIGRNVTGGQGDVANLGDLDRLFAQIKREKGRLDIVFANAGVAKAVNNGGARHQELFLRSALPCAISLELDILRCRPGEAAYWTNTSKPQGDTWSRKARQVLQKLLIRSSRKCWLRNLPSQN